MWHLLVVKVLDCQDPLELQGMTHLVEQVSCCRQLIEWLDCSYIVNTVSTVLCYNITAEYKLTQRMEGVGSSYILST